MKFSCNRPVVSEEKSFEIVDGRTTEPAYTISSPGAFGSGELKNIVIILYIGALYVLGHLLFLKKYLF